MVILNERSFKSSCPPKPCQALSFVLLTNLPACPRRPLVLIAWQRPNWVGLSLHLCWEVSCSRALIFCCSWGGAASAMSLRYPLFGTFFGAYILKESGLTRRLAVAGTTVAGVVALAVG